MSRLVNWFHRPMLLGVGDVADAASDCFEVPRQVIAALDKLARDRDTRKVNSRHSVASCSPEEVTSSWRWGAGIGPEPP